MLVNVYRTEHTGVLHLKCLHIGGTYAGTRERLLAGDLSGERMRVPLM
jgi:hypothetical protein